jgi:hypothetical protein
MIANLIPTRGGNKQTLGQNRITKTYLVEVEDKFSLIPNQGDNRQKQPRRRRVQMNDDIHNGLVEVFCTR